MGVGRQKRRGRTIPCRMNKDGNRSIRGKIRVPSSLRMYAAEYIAIGLKGLQRQAEEFAFYPEATGLLRKGLACSEMSYGRKAMLVTLCGNTRLERNEAGILVKDEVSSPEVESACLS